MWKAGAALVLAVALTAAPAAAQEDGEGEVKDLSGTSIIGNKEVPKSLFIVPWKSSEVGVETGVNSDLLNQELEVVDREVFRRQLEYYEISRGDGQAADR